MQLKHEKPNGKKNLLKAHEVAKRLSISRSLAYHLMQTGEIPAVRIRNLVRVRESDLEEFIEKSWSGWKNT